MGDGSRAPRAEYVAAVDWLKAAAIVTVVWIHAFTTLRPPATAALFALDRISIFAVPAFFFASGFLYNQGEVIRWREARRRLLRILIPYLLASIVAEGFKLLNGGAVPTPGRFVYDLAIGNTLGIYYFVPVLALAVPLAMLLSRRPALFRPLLVLFLVGGLLSAMRVTGLNFFWRARTPIHWWGFFLVGWAAAPGWPRFARLERGPRLLLSGALALLVGAFGIYVRWKGPEEMGRLLGALNYPAIYAVILAILAAAATAEGNAIVRWLAGASYPIYLYHFFFLRPVKEALRGSAWPGGLLTWGAGLGGAILLCLIMGRLLGPVWSLRLLGLRTDGGGRERTAPSAS